MDELKNEIVEQSEMNKENEIIEEYSDIFVGRQYGYFEILRKAGRNRYHQQLFNVRCNCCKQLFTKTLYKIKLAEGETKCKHTHKTTKAATEPHPCAYCGEMTTNLKYCTASCKTAAINKETKTKTKLCLECGKPTPKYSMTLCSNECRRIHRLKTMFGIEIEKDENENYIEKEKIQDE